MATDNTHLHLLRLPPEVLDVIVYFLSDFSLSNLSQVCRRFREICSDPVKMQQRCLRFEWWEDRHHIEEKKACKLTTEVDWRALFVERFKIHRATTYLLNQIIENPTDHIVNFNKIARFGYDAKDCLSLQAEVGDDEVDDPLARRYHAKAAIRFIHRRRALAIWKRVRSHDDVPLEVALLALELFVLPVPGPDIKDILKQLDNLAVEFQESHPDLGTMSSDDTAIALVRWMWARGFSGTPAEHYRALKNVFIGMTLSTIRSAIPLTLVAIFCALARRIGLKAHACGYPGHVLAIVEDPVTSVYRYYDLFSPANHPRADKKRLVAGFVGDETSVVSTFLAPAPTSFIVVRAAQNIISTLQLPPHERAQQNYGYPHVCESAALYAALTAMVVLKPGTGPINRMVVTHMTQQIPEEFPMDVTFLEEELLPKIQEPDGKTLLENVCNALHTEDSTPKPVSRRDTPANQAVQYRVGTVFSHKRYAYEGVIVGWTTTCQPAAGEKWIKEMSVDKLPRGRNQPFYHVLVASDGTVRYVAQENINPTTPSSASEFYQLAGKYFKRFSPEEGRFVSNVKAEFPDD